MFLFLVWVAMPLPTPTVSGDGKVLTIEGNGTVTQKIAREKGTYGTILQVIVKEADSLDNLAFQYFGEMRSITLPQKMSKIGSHCFYSCKKLQHFAVPEGVTSILISTFYDCSELQSFRISSTVQSINSRTFYGCYSLINFSVSLDNSNFSTDESKQFLLDKSGNILYFAASPKSVKIPSKPKIIDSYFINCVYSITIDFSESNINIIRENAFSETSFSKIIFPQTLKRLESPFSSVSVKQISVPETLEYFAENTLQGVSGLESFEVGSNPLVFKVIDGIIYNKEQTKIFFVPSTQSTFYIPLNVLSVDFPMVRSATITNVTVEKNHSVYSSVDLFLFNSNGDELLACPGGLQKAVIPQCCKHIAEYAFAKVSIKEVILNEGLITISRNSFAYCHNLVRVTLSSSLQSIGMYAFMGIKAPDLSLSFSSNLSSVDICGFVDSKLKSINFERCLNLTTLSPRIFQDANIQELILHPNIDTINNRAFYRAIIASPLKFPNIKTIEQKAFLSSRIASVSFEGANIQTIEDSAFEDSSITEFALPYSVTDVKIGGFKGCRQMRAFIVSNASNLQRIWSGAFSDCSSLSSFNIGPLVTEIANGAFSGCTNLTWFSVSKKNQKFSTGSDRELLRMDGGSTLHSFAGGCASCELPLEITEVAPMTFLDCLKLERFSISDGSEINSIRDSTFKGCTQLTLVNIKFAQKITNVEPLAFSGCSSLREIAFSGSLSSIGFSAFAGCHSLASVALPSVLTAIGESAFADCPSLKEIIFCGMSEPVSLSGASKEGIFGGSPCDIVVVPIGYTGKIFCGMDIIEGVDKDCQFCSAVFSAGAGSEAIDIILFAMSLLQDKSEIEGG